MSVAAALASVRARVEAAARDAKRDPSSVKIVAVSKTHAAELVREAYAAGQRAFGESYAQELEEKSKALADLADIEWHFIGHLQSNKAKIVARSARLVHAVHSVDLAVELGKRAASAGRAPIDVLAEVKLSDEASKHGASRDELGALLDAIEKDSNVRLRGLMTMPKEGDEAAAKRVFDELRALRETYGGVARLPALSMGMTDDFEIAIASGATIVRIGTAIFGERAG